MNPNKALWEKGDFTKLAETMRESGSALVDKIGIKKDMKVLDLGCGDGTTAIPGARTGADVTGIDIARNLVEAGNLRAQEEGLSNCRFLEGDAIDLQGVNENEFDLVVSIFGAMFAPQPEKVAMEMVRVTKPGGRIVMGNWIPGDPTLVAQILKTSSAYTPPPPDGFVSPMLWGVEKNVVDRFAGAGILPGQISFSRETFVFQSSYPPSHFLDTFKNFYGPTMNAFEAAEKNGKEEELKKELEDLFIRENKSDDPHATMIPATYLLVNVMK